MLFHRTVKHDAPRTWVVVTHFTGNTSADKVASYLSQETVDTAASEYYQSKGQ